MNIYRVFRVGVLDSLPTGTVLEAVIVALTGDLARGMVAIQDGADQARDWLDQDVTRVQEIGVTTVEHDDDLVEGDNVPYAVIVSRKLSRETGETK